MPTVIGLLGSQLDRGAGPRRWDGWRPTVSIVQHEDLLVERLILLVDPHLTTLADVVCADVARLSPETRIERVPLTLADPWDFEEVYGALHDVAAATRFDDDEDVLVHITTGSHVAQICWFLLAESRRLRARLLQTGPPRRGDRTRAGTWQIIDLDLQRYDRIAARFSREQGESLTFLKAGIATRNPAFNQMMEELERVATASTAPILLTGPTGAGKTRLARRIHALKRERRRLAGPLVEVNCATLRGDAAMSALFGHVRGAYTGADRARDGLLRAADGGMLFLDEVGELGLDEQALLLRAIEEGRWLPVGSDREATSRFELIAGTNRDLRAAVRDGRFREDLLARIDLWHFRLPGLAERPEDIEPNLDWELRSWEERGGRALAFNREARAAFLAFATSPEATWTGNFRDLAAAVTRLGTLADGRRVDRALVDAEIARLRASWGAPAEVDDVVARLLPDVPLDRAERAQLAEVLRVCAASRSVSAAGRALYAVSRTQRGSVNDADRLRKYLARHGLDFEGVRAALARPPVSPGAPA